jgi:hypothetical protein
MEGFLFHGGDLFPAPCVGTQTTVTLLVLLMAEKSAHSANFLRNHFSRMKK